MENSVYAQCEEAWPERIITAEENEDDLSKLRTTYPKDIILTYINVNSIRHNLNDIYALTAETVDVLCIAESKLDESLPESQFLLPGFHKPYRLDKTASSGGLLVYVRRSIASSLMNLHHLPTDIQLIPIELNLLKKKKALTYIV